MANFIMRTTGDVDMTEYFSNIPNLKVCVDTNRNAMHTFRDSLIMAGDLAYVNMEDDIILCDNFAERICAEIEKRPNDVIQFFSMRKNDLTIGSRYIPGSQYCMNQCFYLPAGMSADLLVFLDNWDRIEEEPTGCDYVIADYLKFNKIKYWNVCPNLVDHKPIKSRINPKRSTKRQSFTFYKESEKEVFCLQ